MSFTILPLAQMSIKSGIIIIFIAILRKFFLFRFPKRVFLSLWMIAISRLLIPLSVSVAFIPPLSLSHSWEPDQIPLEQPYLPAHSNMMTAGYMPPTHGIISPLSMWSILWITGSILVAFYFLISFVTSRLKFSESIPIKSKDAELWLSQHPLRRSIRIRACTHITSPLTYGIFRPTILFPMDMDFSRTNELRFVLLHEYTHIKYFHGAIKLLIVLCLCLHWFNPTVWMLYFLANKDMELFCDEIVLREHNGRAKTDYAHALIHMSMGTAANLHLHNNFSERALKERIVAIMKHKKYSVLSLLLALVLVVSVTCVAFASTNAEDTPDASFSIEDMDEAVEAPDSAKWVSSDGPVTFENVPADLLDNTPTDAPAYKAAPLDLSGVTPLGTGALAPGRVFNIDPQRMAAGQSVTVNVEYTPTNTHLIIGVKNTVTNQTQTQFAYGGSGTAVITIPTTGTYCIYVANPSASITAHVNISYFLR